MKIMSKKIIALAMALSMGLSMLSAVPVSADANSLLWDSKQSDIQTNTGLGARDPRDIVASVIKTLLGFLGLIAVVIILVGGFKWMTSQGSDDKIDEAKKMIVSGFVGLLIILAAFGLATFVIDKIYGVTGAQG